MTPQLQRTINRDAPGRVFAALPLAGAAARGVAETGDGESLTGDGGETTARHHRSSTHSIKTVHGEVSVALPPARAAENVGACESPAGEWGARPHQDTTAPGARLTKTL